MRCLPAPGVPVGTYRPRAPFRSPLMSDHLDAFLGSSEERYEATTDASAPRSRASSTSSCCAATRTRASSCSGARTAGPRWPSLSVALARSETSPD